MTNFMYLRCELLRSFRNKRFLLLTLALPIVLYLTVTGSYRHATYQGIAFPVFYMTAMTTMGTMSAVLFSASVLATDRAVGWTRQMRITPLTTRSYFSAKIVSGYLRALLTIVLLAAAGTAYGVRLSAGQWLTVLGLILVGLIPFALLGILLGHLLNADSSGPAMGGLTALFALLGGAYGFQVVNSGALFDVIQALPSYWLVQAGRTVVNGGGWPAHGWIVIAAWTVVLAPLTVFVYRRDTSRV